MLIYFLSFLGGIALFLYGMQLMGDGLQKAAGAKLQRFLEVATGNLLKGIGYINKRAWLTFQRQPSYIFFPMSEDEVVSLL